MNSKTTHLAVVLFVLLSSSCSSEINTKGNAFPDGKYPLTFASSVEGMTLTRATADGTWTEGDKVAVKVGDIVKEYTVAIVNNMLSADAPFYWQNSGETKTVSAWHCGDGSTASGETHAEAVPATWSVKPDQSSDGYQQSDFLYAPAKEITFSDDTKSLAFYHQTARVVINIKNAEAATKEEDIKGVVIGYAGNLALSGTYTAPVGTGVTAGTWIPVTAAPGMGTITPKDITASAGSILKTYTALVIPQNMQSKKFLAVTRSNDRVYYYIPSRNDEANLKSGQVYTYNVTVKADKIDVIAVNDSSGSWGGGGSNPEDINSHSTP